MFVPIYFGVISSTLLCCFLPKELEGYFKHTFIFPLSFYHCCPLFSLSVLLPYFDLLGFHVDFLCHGMEMAHCGQGRVDMLCCHGDPWLSQHPLKLQSRAAAADVETPVTQVNVRDLRSVHSSCLLLTCSM